MTSAMPRGRPVSPPQAGDPGRTPPPAPPTSLRHYAVKWLPWLALILAGAWLAVIVTSGDERAGAPAGPVEPYETPGVIADANLPGHVLEAMTLGEIDATDPEVLGTLNPPAHILEEIAVGYADAAPAPLDPGREFTLVANANLPGHVLEAMTLGEVLPYAGSDLLTTLNPPAHVLEEMIEGTGGR